MNHVYIYVYSLGLILTQFAVTFATVECGKFDTNMGATFDITELTRYVRFAIHE